MLLNHNYKKLLKFQLQLKNYFIIIILKRFNLAIIFLIFF